MAGKLPCMPMLNALKSLQRSRSHELSSHVGKLTMGIFWAHTCCFIFLHTERTWLKASYSGCRYA